MNERMLKQSVLFIAVLAFTFTLAPTAKAQSFDLQAMLARMNEIVAEMEELRNEFATIANAVSGQNDATTPSVLGAATSDEPVFTEPLEYSETNSDIRRIQKLLATDEEIYPYGVASGFFGPKTEEALQNLQARQGWETPGVVGPSTRALLEDYFRAYPDENWPADVLKSDPPAPQVQGASVSAPTTPTPTTNSSAGNSARAVNVNFSGSEALIEIIYSNGNRKGMVADTTDEDEVIEYIAGRTVLTETMIREVVDFDGRADEDEDADEDEEDEAEEAFDDAEDAIDDADEEIDEAEEDGEDTDWAEDTLDEAEGVFEEAEEAFDDGDYDEAIELAEEAEEMAEEAEDRIGEDEDDHQGDNDEIEEINVEVDDGESEVTVEYEDGGDYEFEVEEDDEDDIIEEVADELNMDEDDVEDLIEFDYGDLDRIEVRLDDGEALVRIFYESGVERRLRPNTDDEDEIIEEIADELDEDEDDIERLVDFSD